jgi:acetyl-CoA C-acetyltransferase
VIKAAIVATARTPIAKAYRGAFTNTPGQALAARAISHALDVAGVEPSLVENDGMKVTVGGGVESISLVQNQHANDHRARDPWLADRVAGLYFPMVLVHTPEIVAKRDGVSRERQDNMAPRSQELAAAASVSGVMDAEIVPITVMKMHTDRDVGETSELELTLSHDEGIRCTTAAELADLEMVLRPGEVTERPTVREGNASQLSDGASASVLVDSEHLAALGVEALGYHCGIAVTGCDPSEMGIGPVTATPRLLKTHGLTIDDFGVWEINEALAAQAVYCADRLKIDSDKVNVDGGAIALGLPYGMTGAPAVGHALLEAKRRGEQFAVVSTCVGGGMGAAGLVEVA